MNILQNEHHGNVPNLEKLGQLIRALHISADPFFIQPSRQTISTTSGCWFICHNVQRNRLQQSSLLWKPIFGHTNLPNPIVQRVMKLHTERKLSQKALAEQLQLAGYEFSVLTVLRTEKGTR